MRVDIQREFESPAVPDNRALERFAGTVAGRAPDGEVCLRIVGEAEGRALNRRWRGRDHATNVLSFPATMPPGLPAGAAPRALGDIVLCAPVIAREARAQGKPCDHHWAHLVIHGLLHLLGFDHIEPVAAERMERTEREILARLGIPDPYRPMPHGVSPGDAA